MALVSGPGEARGHGVRPPFAAVPSVLDGVAVGIYSVGPDGLCTQINTAAAAMLGYSEAECIGYNMHSLIHYKHPDGTLYPMEDCPISRMQRKHFTVLTTVWTKSGHPVQVACSAAPIFADNVFQGTVVTLNDIRPQREAEDRLQQAEQWQHEAMRQRDATARVEQELASEQAIRHRENCALLERVAAEQLRQQQLQAEERLIQSERLAAVGRLSASIAHEINNPLEAITNLLYLVRNDSSLSPESVDYIRLAESELGRVTEIVAQTLRFQRSSASAAPCSPAALVGTVLALHQGRLHNSGIRIDLQHRQDRAFSCHGGDIRQILNNLVSNALDAMPPSGGTLAIRTRPSRSPKTGAAGLRITVSDNGHGMSHTTLSRIFAPFYTTKGASGSGLGLWISRSIAHRHGGSLRVRSNRSERHRGTTFSLFLPERRPEAATAGTVQ